MTTLPDQFTTTEFIALTGLAVDINDPHATRLIAQKLRSKGYVKKTMRGENGKNRSVWYRKTEVDKMKEELKERLNDIFPD